MILYIEPLIWIKGADCTEIWKIILKDDYHYWLHRGSLEVEWGDLGHAENFLSQAMSFNDHDPFVRNEWAYLLFKKAVKFSGATEAPDLVQEASDGLLALINDPHANSPHPYHVLGSQGLAWSRKGIRGDEERKKYLIYLDQVISRGAKEFPKEQKLQILKDDIKKEVLSTAVRH